MARGLSNLLTSSVPRTVAPADVTIGHIQLRDVVICPHERGTVCYPQIRHIVEHDLTAPSAPPRPIVDLKFTPNSLSSLVLNDTNETLLAAGGQEAELHLSLYSPPAPSTSPDDASSYQERSRPKRFGPRKWIAETNLKSASINNSVMLTSLNLSKSHESCVEPRVVVSNNDKSVKFFDVAVRSSRAYGAGDRLVQAGQLRLEVPVNHSSISPDARTLLSVGDSPDVYLHRISGGSHLSFTQMAKLSLAPFITAVSSYNYGPYSSPSSSVPASFSTSFSANGSKFAVASQEGVVVVWDVRSTKPLKVIQTDKGRGSSTGSARSSNANSLSWSYDNSWDWARGSNAPGWGVRSIKFSPQGVGQEVLTFTEHTSVLHVLDARTFETEEIVRVPNFDCVQLPRPSTARPRSLSPPRVSPTPVEPPSILPPPPRILLFSGAVEDTFRIPLSEPAARRRRLNRRLRNRDGSSATASGSTDQEDVDSIVVVPPLGNRELDDRVQTLLGQISDLERRTDGLSRRIEDDERVEDDMDVDELEADCLSSHTPSRAPSPVPVPPSTSAPSTSAPGGSLARLPSPYDLLRSASRTSHISRRETSGPYVPRRPSGQPGLRRHRRSNQPESNTNPLEEIEQDLAGMCFDPTGEYIYVGAVKGISEWKVRGAEKSWWVDSAWA